MYQSADGAESVHRYVSASSYHTCADSIHTPSITAGDGSINLKEDDTPVNNPARPQLNMVSRTDSGFMDTTHPDGPKTSRRRGQPASSSTSDTYKERTSSTRSSSGATHSDASSISTSHRPSTPKPATRSHPHMYRRSSSYTSALPADPLLAYKRATEIVQMMHSNPCQQTPETTCPSHRPSTRKQPPVHHHPDDHTAHHPNSTPIKPLHPAPTTIDWTRPSTRRREYELYDRKRRGLRGLWRKMVPSWWRNSSRLSFYEAEKDDGGSVRKFRLELDDEGDGVLEDEEVEDKEEDEEDMIGDGRRRVEDEDGSLKDIAARKSRIWTVFARRSAARGRAW